MKRRGANAPLLFVQPSLLTANVRWSDTVPSDYNIGFFQHWIQRQIFEVQIIYMTVLYVIIHAGSSDTAETYKLADGNRYRLMHIKCTNAACVRCQSRQGGFRFGWQGPWTCRRAFGPHDSPRSARASMALCAVLNLCEACVYRSVAIQYVVPVDIARVLKPHLLD